MKYVKKYWPLAALIVILYWKRISIASWIYEQSGGKISLFGVHGGSV